jgi:MFS family permease
LPRATAANAVSGQAAQIVGPALGGFLYAAGAEVVYAVTAGLYLLSLILVLTLRYEQALPPRTPPTLSSLFAGVDFIRKRPDVLGVISSISSPSCWAGRRRYCRFCSRCAAHRPHWSGRVAQCACRGGVADGLLVKPSCA